MLIGSEGLVCDGADRLLFESKKLAEYSSNGKCESSSIVEVSTSSNGVCSGGIRVDHRRDFPEPDARVHRQCDFAVGSRKRGEEDRESIEERERTGSSW